MLVLSRHRDESIIIGDDIVITVVDIRGDKVRLGIAAPIEISVHRQEVYEAIQRENRQASRLEPQDARQLEHLERRRSGATYPVARVPTASDCAVLVRPTPGRFRRAADLERSRRPGSVRSRTGSPSPTRPLAASERLSGKSILAPKGRQ